MKVQEALANCCQTFQAYASSTASWMASTMSSLYGYAADFASRVATYAAPYFENVKNFVADNKPYFVVAGVAAASTAILYNLVQKACAAPARA